MEYLTEIVKYAREAGPLATELTVCAAGLTVYASLLFSYSISTMTDTMRKSLDSLDRETRE